MNVMKSPRNNAGNIPKNNVVHEKPKNPVLINPLSRCLRRTFVATSLSPKSTVGIDSGYTFNQQEWAKSP
jgi:hypothetical protein